MDQKLGSFGDATETFSAGVAKAAVTAVLPATSFGLTGSVQVALSLDAGTLIAFIAAKIGGPVPAEVAAFLEAALKAT